MSDEKTQILIRALEASGSEREAKLARAILGETPAAAPAATPAAPAAPVAPVAEPQGAQLPPGILSQEATNAELDRIERLPPHEQNKLDKTQVMASWEFHNGGNR